jgi:hypothetical protein
MCLHVVVPFIFDVMFYICCSSDTESSFFFWGGGGHSICLNELLGVGIIDIYTGPSGQTVGARNLKFNLNLLIIGSIIFYISIINVVLAHF